MSRVNPGGVSVPDGGPLPIGVLPRCPARPVGDLADRAVRTPEAGDVRRAANATGAVAPGRQFSKAADQAAYLGVTDRTVENDRRRNSSPVDPPPTQEAAAAARRGSGGGRQRPGSAAPVLAGRGPAPELFLHSCPRRSCSGRIRPRGSESLVLTTAPNRGGDPRQFTSETLASPYGLVGEHLAVRAGVPGLEAAGRQRSDGAVAGAVGAGSARRAGHRGVSFGWRGPGHCVPKWHETHRTRSSRGLESRSTVPILTCADRLWSGRRESNSRYQLGKLKFCH